tara:strand:+ start:356 stop:580 length:225 start_codon:yes stop_codon:yes gene_type:complete
MIKETFLNQCLDILKQEEVKKEIKLLIKPIVDMILQEIYPYIYLSVLLVIFSFFLTLGIFILLFRMRIIIPKKE